MLLLAAQHKPSLTSALSRSSRDKARRGERRRGAADSVCIGRMDAKHTLCNGLLGKMIHEPATMHLYTNFNYANDNP